MASQRTIGVVLFPGFELLDVFGHLEMYGIAEDAFRICMVAESSEDVASRQGPKSAVEHTFDEPIFYDILLVPGGRGTRQEVGNESMLAWLGLENKHRVRST